MNLLEGKVARSNGAPSDRDRAQGPSRRSSLPVPASADAAKLADGAKVIFGIRPEAVNDNESVDRNARSVATFDAGRNRRARGVGHLRRHPRRRQGTDRADARRTPRARRPEPHLRLQPRQGGAVRSADDAADLTKRALAKRVRESRAMRRAPEVNEEPWRVGQSTS